MADYELVKKMLRAILQSSKSGLPLSRLQAEYKELTGEAIPHKQLGHATLDTLLHSMSSVVRLDRGRSGEVMCYATVGNEMAHITKLAARHHTAKKTGRPQVVNCQMRVKPSAPLVLNAKPRTSLRQPEHRGRQGRGGGRPGGHGDSRPGSMREQQPDGKGSKPHSTQHTPPNTPTRRPNLPSDRSDKRMTLPSRFQKEVHAHLSRNPQQSNAPFNLNESTTPPKPRTPHSSPYSPKLVQSRLKEVLSKHSNGLWVSKLPQLYRELYKQDLPSEALKDLEEWTHICTIEKPCSSKPQELLLYPAKDISQTTTPPSPAMTPTANKQSPPTQKPPSQIQQAARTPPTSTSSPPASPTVLSADLKQKLGELLLKYSSGLWAHALPKLYQDTYKTKLPEYVLDNLPLLSDICTIDYPMPDNPKRAILYVKAVEDENCNQEDLADLRAREEAGRRISYQTVPPLLIPREEYPSVLVVEASNTNSVVLRYIGEGYSKAQEKLEDEMKEFYGQDNTKKSLVSPSSGQLTAVHAEEEEEILRAQVCEVMSEKVKVYYVDHGFSEVISKSKLLELHEKFFRLPFQATKCKLAGLEPFSQEPVVLKKFDSMASGKILLAEILERNDIPLMVLYDTSQDDDVNINAACLKALQDKSLESPMQVNSAYMNVNVTSVSSDGTFCCQLPSRGLTKLNEVLEKAETYFHSQVTSESLVSRPFCGKSCLARFKGKWSRVEITNLHGSRVLDILFVDLGVQASVEVIELREIPPPFLRDLTAIPPQAVKCCLADLSVSVGSWTPDAVQWLRDRALQCSDCSLKIAKVEESKCLAHVYLFTSKNFHDLSRSLNHQLAESDLWKHQKDVFLSSQGPLKTPSSPKTPPTTPPNTNSTGNSSPSTNGRSKAPQTSKKVPPQSRTTSPITPPRNLALPPVLELPPAGHNIDIYVSVACHPGHFVLQPWQDMYKLVVLMGEMILYYNKTEEKPLTVEKNQVYAAKVENNWHRVLVKGVLTNGLVSVYELDYGKHELVSCTLLRPLIQEFRQLPFQGITAQLAGVKPRQWSEEASIVFRNHVEKKPLVAQLDSVQDAAQPWDRKVTVFLVDTSQEDRDVWVHDIMAEFADELTKAA
ncbi:tudor domain-containing protein 7B isoform X1 [Astyanax mexicanus]|uniref:tudor domain-containing protein 7B isoform X1 n=3 Tax=Astyanax mexicanus TaxID=7994 RepID=UPI0020CAEF7C|nr:tudor domain-containing protein 7B isoform X1 [Astyanax mexicanus]